MIFSTTHRMSQRMTRRTTERRMAPRVAALAWAAALISSAGLARAEGSEGAAGSAAPSTDPWRPGHEYTLIWTYDGKRAGGTKFRLAPPSRDGEHRLESVFSFERDAAIQSARRTLVYGPDWGLRKFQASTFMGHSTGRRSRVDTQGWVQGDTLVCEAVHNSDEADTGRVELALPPGARVMVAHAVESWAIVMWRLAAAGDAIPPQRIAYPDFNRVYDVRFELLGRPTLDVLGATSSTRHYRFRSDDKQLEGEAWVEANGRLVRYRQGPLVIELTQVEAVDTPAEDVDRGIHKSGADDGASKKSDAPPRDAKPAEKPSAKPAEKPSEKPAGGKDDGRSPSSQAR